MDLQALFFVSLSIEAIIITISTIVVMYYFLKIIKDVTYINKKIVETVDESVAAVGEAKEYIGKTGRIAIDYLILKVADLIDRKGRRNN